MMKCYRVTDGSSEHDLFLIVIHQTSTKRNFSKDWARAVAQAKEENPDEWNRSEVIEIMQKMGWELLAPNYETIYEEM